MKRKLASSETSFGKSSEASTEDFTIYDVPGAILDARGEAYTLLKHPDEAVRTSAQRIIDMLSRSIRAMGREDVGVLRTVEDKPEAALSAQPDAA